MLGSCFLKLFLRTNFKNTKIVVLVLFENYFYYVLVSEFNVFFCSPCFLVYKKGTKRVFRAYSPCFFLKKNNF